MGDEKWEGESPCVSTHRAPYNCPVLKLVYLALDELKNGVQMAFERHIVRLEMGPVAEFCVPRDTHYAAR